MRDFSWNVFTATGDIDAYLLYKASEHRMQEEDVVSRDTEQSEEAR